MASTRSLIRNSNNNNNSYITRELSIVQNEIIEEENEELQYSWACYTHRLINADDVKCISLLHQCQMHQNQECQTSAYQNIWALFNNNYHYFYQLSDDSSRGSALNVISDSFFDYLCSTAAIPDYFYYFYIFICLFFF